MSRALRRAAERRKRRSRPDDGQSDATTSVVQWQELSRTARNSAMPFRATGCRRGSEEPCGQAPHVCGIIATPRVACREPLARSLPLQRSRSGLPFTAGGCSCRITRSPHHRPRITVRVATTRRRRSHACWVMAESARAASSVPVWNVRSALTCRNWKRGSRTDRQLPSSPLADGLERVVDVLQ